MIAVKTIRHSQVWVWIFVCLLAAFLVLAVLVRVAAANDDEPRVEPVATYIVSPSNGTFIAGEYRGADPCVSVGSSLELGTIVGNVEVWGRLHPIHSMSRGTVVEVLVFDDALIEARQPLFKVQIETEPTPT
jgi:biotin carboxyl carrier protein